MATAIKNSSLPRNNDSIYEYGTEEDEEDSISLTERELKYMKKVE